MNSERPFVRRGECGERDRRIPMVKEMEESMPGSFIGHTIQTDILGPGSDGAGGRAASEARNRNPDDFVCGGEYGGEERRMWSNLLSSFGALLSDHFLPL